MISKTLAAGLIAAGCVTAAGTGAYLAVRQNAVEQLTPAVSQPTPAPGAEAAPVSETEAIVSAPAPAEPAAPAQAVEEVERPAPAPVAPPAPIRRLKERDRAPAPRTARAATIAPEPQRVEPETTAVNPVPEPAVVAPPVYAEPARELAPPPAPPEPRFEELVVPAATVIGLQVETPVSTERARLEDRVDARVTRDVLSAGRVAIPAGARVIGSVTLVERGGKVKERARLGVRFHTLVLADGSQVPLRTDAILREGDPPSGESARKIGGAAIGGAILGAIMGGGKGAVIGGATGAGAGTAAVMAGDRNAATLQAGTIVNVRLTAPTTLEVERR
jgi:hypothetical protein